MGASVLPGGGGGGVAGAAECPQSCQAGEEGEELGLQSVLSLAGETLAILRSSGCRHYGSGGRGEALVSLTPGVGEEGGDGDSGFSQQHFF